MTIDLGVVIAAMVPTVVVGVIAFFMSKRWEAIDKGIEGIRTDLKEHNRQSDDVHTRIWREVNSGSARLSKIEGRME